MSKNVLFFANNILNCYNDNGEGIWQRRKKQKMKVLINLNIV